PTCCTRSHHQRRVGHFFFARGLPLWAMCASTAAFANRHTDRQRDRLGAECHEEGEHYRSRRSLGCSIIRDVSRPPSCKSCQRRPSRCQCVPSCTSSQACPCSASCPTYPRPRLLVWLETCRAIGGGAAAIPAVQEAEGAVELVQDPEVRRRMAEATTTAT
ncbi:unnamed protein product, partial [Scytosiphon promiscuus]